MLQRYRILYDTFANTIEPGRRRFRKGQIVYGYEADGYAWLSADDGDGFFHRTELSHVRRLSA